MRDVQQKPARRIRRCHFAVPNTWTAFTVPGRDGREIREKPHRARRESCDVGRRVLRAEGWVAIAAPSPLGQGTVSRERTLLQASARVDRGATGDVDVGLVVRPSRTRQGGVAGHLSDSNEGGIGTAISARLADAESTARDVP